MSITRTNAKTFISRILGGANSSQVNSMAEDAILEAFTDWENAKNWKFLLKDTGNGFQVSGVTLTVSTSVTAPSSGAFDAVNIGVTVTDSGGKIPANTTIASFTRNTDGTVATIVLSNTPASGSGLVLTFGADIPIIAGTREYNAPSDFRKSYHARLTSRTKWPLNYIEYRDWNRIVLDQDTQGVIEAYTVYNPVSPLTQNYGTKRLRVFRTPSLSDVLFMQYYRSFSKTADPLDIPDNNLYQFLTYAQWKLLSKKPSGAEKYPDLEKAAMRSLAAAMTDDEEESDDHEARMKSQIETSAQIRPLWTNGQFFPDYGV
jgi:hypothetical protein